MWVELASRPRLGGVGMVYRWCQHSMVGIKSRNPDQESSFTEASPELYSDFFTALRANSSITKISVRATQDGEPFSTQKIRLFFENFSLCLAKDKLKEIELKEIKLEVTRRCLEN
ncbi:hypothetical protein Pcinc_017833 [Petrolisthes cinctipes]|uniref:Uncharacterized protein n=1 Tax=Petrolisthes cinctipes TaxID=88211 RepID=A0AAE1FNG4_PETCI|nr:hypothetical protein Pcinc_017833 [Petrolisthes cinctipes]